MPAVYTYLNASIPSPGVLSTQIRRPCASARL